ncbi:unnamed protein product [Leuciscus chuanchicus]
MAAPCRALLSARGRARPLLSSHDATLCRLRPELRKSVRPCGMFTCERNLIFPSRAPINSGSV